MGVLAAIRCAHNFADDRRNVPGHAAQSADFWIWGPGHWAPPFNGIGLLQVRERFLPWLGLPAHLHSRHGLQVLQPPLTVG